VRLYRDGKPVELSADGEAARLEDRIVVHTSEGTFTGLALVRGNTVLASFRGQNFVFDRTQIREQSRGPEGDGNLRAPLPGVIVEVTANVGDELKAGSKVAVLEAMKTQFPVVMPFDGVVETIEVEVGKQLELGSLIATVRKSTPEI
jgi:biotin carboxyl carrier protein